MLIHGGFFIPPVSAHSSEQDSLQPTSQQHNFVSDPIKHICPGYDLAVTLRVVPKLIKYQGSIRHRIKSRTWNTGHDGVSLKIESIRKLCPGEALNRGRSQSKRRMREYSQERLRVLANIRDENTESLQNERAMRTATFEFTHQGDPCFKYSPELVMDRHDGLSRKWTSWRLKKEVLILENDEERYEISLQHHAGTNARRFDQYRFAVISPRTSLSGWSKASYPLDSTNLTEVLYEDLDWQDFEWVERGVVVQPSQRAKQSTAQSNTSSLMEGVEPTSESPQYPIRTRPTIDTSKPTSETTMPMDTEDVGANDMARDGTGSSNAALSGPSVSGSLEVQQDGVFCVVSRLFWRPMTEQRSTNLPGAGSSPSTDSRVAKDADKTMSTESHSQHGLKGMTPATMSISSTTRPLQEQVESGTNTDLRHRPNAAPSTDVARKDDAIEPVLAISQAPAIPYSAQLSDPHAPSVPNTGANNMEVDIGLNKPASTTTFGEQPPHGPRQAEATVPAPDFNLAEHEDGELEEGEITSD
ncbi:hypothetical protein EDD21DRAFT_145117 [Dissophora ornata]|nr:hypothetical protein EDD21DRAFT_145117 [Dissophora ornata]